MLTIVVRKPESDISERPHREWLADYATHPVIMRRSSDKNPSALVQALVDSARVCVCEGKRVTANDDLVFILRNVDASLAEALLIIAENLSLDCRLIHE